MWGLGRGVGGAFHPEDTPGPLHQERLGEARHTRGTHSSWSLAALGGCTVLVFCRRGGALPGTHALEGQPWGLGTSRMPAGFSWGPRP